MSEFIPDIVGYEQNQRARRTPGANLSRYEEVVARNRTGESTETSGVDAFNRDNPVNPVKVKGKSRKSPIDVYTQMLQKLLGGEYRKPYDDLTKQLNTLGGQAQSTINTSMDNLQSFLEAQTNPFANFQAAQTQVNPALDALLQSQGIESTPLQQYATAVNAQQGAQTNAFQNMVGTLSGMQDAMKSSRVGDVALNRANLQSNLASNQAGLGAGINQQALGQRNDLMAMLLQAIGQGGQTKGRIRL